MKRLRLVLLKTVLVPLFAMSSTFALANSHEEAAYELLDVLQINQLMSESIDAILQMQLEANPSLQPYEATMKEFFDLYMSGNSLKYEFSQLYMEAFNEQELKELAAFYRTPTGKKAMKVSSALMAKGAAIGQQRVMENAHELDRMIKEESARIKALQGQ